MSTELLEQHRKHKERQLRIKAAALKSAPHNPLPPITAPQPLPPPEPPQVSTKSIGIVTPLGISATIDLVVNEVCDHYKVTTANLLSYRRRGSIVESRQMLVYLLYKITTFTNNQIAEKLNRDHTTIGYAINKIERDIDKYKDVVKLLEDRINEKLAQRKTVFVA